MANKVLPVSTSKLRLRNREIAAVTAAVARGNSVRKLGASSVSTAVGDTPKHAYRLLSNSNTRRDVLLVHMPEFVAGRNRVFRLTQDRLPWHPIRDHHHFHPIRSAVQLLAGLFPSEPATGLFYCSP